MVICDYCQRPANLVSGKRIYPNRPDLYQFKFWLCEPCDAYVGCHKNSEGRPLGRLAKADLRKAKSSAHLAFDPIWKSGRLRRKEAYLWLAVQLEISSEKCHIGMFDKDTCLRVVDICKNKAP